MDYLTRWENISSISWERRGPPQIDGISMPLPQGPSRPALASTRAKRDALGVSRRSARSSKVEPRRPTLGLSKSINHYESLTIINHTLSITNYHEPSLIIINHHKLVGGWATPLKNIGQLG